MDTLHPPHFWMRSRSFDLEKRGERHFTREAMRRQCLGSRSRGAAGVAPARAPLRLARARPTAKGRTTTVETVARALAEEGSKALAQPTDAVDWDNLSFNCDHVSKTTMFVATATQGADGRDHHSFGFSVWMAGGGIKGGLTNGATDELGYHAVEDPHYVTDIHATINHLMGIDPHKLEVPGHKRLEKDFGHPIREIIA